MSRGYRASLLIVALGLGMPTHADQAGGPVQTLLVPRPAAGTLDLVDPGSGLRLATIALDTGPRRSAVAPDGRHAAVVGCLESGRAADPFHVSLVDVEQPGELLRQALPVTECPATLEWLDASRVAFYDARHATLAQATLPVPPIDGAPPQRALARPQPVAQPALAIDPQTAAAQQFLRDGGRLVDLALAPVRPRAVCHACQPSP